MDINKILFEQLNLQGTQNPFTVDEISGSDADQKESAQENNEIKEEISSALKAQDEASSLQLNDKNETTTTNKTTNNFLSNMLNTQSLMNLLSNETQRYNKEEKEIEKEIQSKSEEYQKLAEEIQEKQEEYEKLISEAESSNDESVISSANSLGEEINSMVSDLESIKTNIQNLETSLASKQSISNMFRSQLNSLSKVQSTLSKEAVSVNTVNTVVDTVDINNKNNLNNIYEAGEETSIPEINMDKIELFKNGGLKSYLGSRCITFNLSEIEHLAEIYDADSIVTLYHYMDVNAVVKEPDWENRLSKILGNENVNKNGSCSNFIYEQMKDAVEIADKTGIDKKYTSLIYGYNQQKSEYYNAFTNTFADESAHLCDFNGDGITDFNDLNNFPDEIDLDGDGTISLQEKTYLKEIKLSAYTSINYGQMQSVTGFYRNLSGYNVNQDADIFYNNIEQIIAREEFRSKNPEIVQMEEDYINLMRNPSLCTVTKNTNDVNLDHWASVGATLCQKYGINFNYASLMNRNAANWFWNKSAYATNQDILDYHDTTIQYANYLKEYDLSKEEYQNIINKINGCTDTKIKEKLSDIKAIVEQKLSEAQNK